MKETLKEIAFEVAEALFIAASVFLLCLKA